MKKYLFICLFMCLFSSAFALSFGDNYTHSSRFWRNSASVYMPVSYAFITGAEFDITEHDDFNNHIYEFRLPLSVQTDDFMLSAVPFVLPDNANGSYAYGGKLLLSTGLKVNEIDLTATEGRISVSAVSQKAGVLKNDVYTEKDTFAQIAYEAGITANYFGAYKLSVVGNVFQFLSGLEGVKGIRGVFNQAELADLGTIDYMLGLPRGSAGARVDWTSQESQTESFISYRYINMHEASTRHSLLVSTNIHINEMTALNFSYNHIFMKRETDIDLFSAGINIGI